MTATHLFDAISIGDRVRLTMHRGLPVEGVLTGYRRTETDVLVSVDGGLGIAYEMRLREVAGAERLWPQMEDA